jgi:hypothetical protein
LLVVHPQGLRVHLRVDKPKPALARLRAAAGYFVALLDSAACGQPFFVAAYNPCRSCIAQYVSPVF